MKKTHCDRCDVTITDALRPVSSTSIPRVFFEEKGQTPDIVNAKVRIVIEHYTVHDNWVEVELCKDCFLAAMRDAFYSTMPCPECGVLDPRGAEDHYDTCSKYAPQ